MTLPAGKLVYYVDFVRNGKSFSFRPDREATVCIGLGENVRVNPRYIMHITSGRFLMTGKEYVILQTTNGCFYVVDNCTLAEFLKTIGEDDSEET